MAHQLSQQRLRHLPEASAKARFNMFEVIAGRAQKLDRRLDRPQNCARLQSLLHGLLLVPLHLGNGSLRILILPIDGQVP